MPADIDPRRLLDDFGVGFGLLASPPWSHRTAGLMSDSSPTGTPIPGGDGPPTYPITLTIRHLLLGGLGLLDVTTRRRHGYDYDLADHLWWSMVDLRLNARPGLAPADVVKHVQQPRPLLRAERLLDVDGRPTPFAVMVDGDYVACGHSDGDELLAVVFPVALDTAPALTRWPLR